MIRTDAGFLLSPLTFSSIFLSSGQRLVGDIALRYLIGTLIPRSCFIDRLLDLDTV